MPQSAAVFEFTSYTFEPDKKRVLFRYTTKFKDRPPLRFTETILLPKIPNLDRIPPEPLKKLLQSLHLILGISYYKFYCPPAVALAKEDAKLSKQEAEFWNIVYKKGLGEFFYKNNLNPNRAPKFPYGVTRNQEPVTSKLRVTGYALPVTKRSLVGIGGGKDSIVAAELLKEGGFDATAFYVQTSSDSSLVNSIIKKTGLPSLKIRRLLDEKVHQPHLYDGHVPVSAILAFLGFFAGILYGFDYVIVGNEYSSNFGNLKYKGLDINHQWSKSFEFETLFQTYVKTFITPDITYFSLLRRFYEIRIVKLFASHKKYFPHFSSCNSNFRIAESRGNLRGKMRNKWCGRCAKCVFVFTLLSAFLPKKELVNIFKKNLYQDKTLLPLFKDILGFGAMKPFDCVGTFEEAQTAMWLAKKRFARDFIMRQLGRRVTFHQEVFTTNKNARIPEQFTFLGMDSTLIAGFGNEGSATKKYLEKYYPKLKLGIAEIYKNREVFRVVPREFPRSSAAFDLAIKTPGIKKELIKIPYTTATNIFFSNISGKYLTIGVTGSKGKSTTASLIFHILKTAGKNVHPVKSAKSGVSQTAKQFNRVKLLGNIGKPMLENLLHPIAKNTIFVLELSSYQLDDLRFSPDIAVVTNLFPEHLDFHGSLQHYYDAKKNIIRYQQPDQYFVYDKKTEPWLKEYRGKPVPFAKTIPVPKHQIPLLGQHNESNIKAAIAVARILKIPEAKIKKAIKCFKGLPHRLENVGTFKGIIFYDDAISTTPESTIMAIKALPGVQTIFLGGSDRGYDFSQLEKTLKQYKIKNVVLFPDTGSRIIKNTKGLNILKTRSMEKAIAFAYKHTTPGHICLLSCASPSYSLWKNFEHKGTQFTRLVKKLAK